MTILPADLQDLLDQIDAADRTGAALAAGVTDEQFRWRPLEGRGWSIAQCLDHLGIMNKHYGAAVGSGIEDGRRRNLRYAGRGRPSFFGRRFIASFEPPARMKLKTPRVALPPLDKPRDAVMRTYHESHDLVRRLIVDAADVDVNRATFQNPFIPLVRMRVATGLAILAAHDRRHLWQAEQVKRAPGYPISSTR